MGVETWPFFAQRSYRMAVSLKCPPIAESDPNLVWCPLPCVLLKKGVTGVETRPLFAQRSYRMVVSLNCPSIAASDPNLVWSPLPFPPDPSDRWILYGIGCHTHSPVSFKSVSFPRIPYGLPMYLATPLLPHRSSKSSFVPWSFVLLIVINAV